MYSLLRRLVTSRTTLRVLAASGLGAGAYAVYTSRSIWPRDLRSDLRAALRAQHAGDNALSERYLRRAWATCLALPPSRLGPDPWLKLSGVATRLAAVLPPADAYAVCADCLARMRAAPALSLPERQRAVALALRLADLAAALARPHDEQHSFLAYAAAESAAWPAPRPLLEHAPVPYSIYAETAEAALAALAAFYASTGDAPAAIAAYTRLLPLMAAAHHPPPHPDAPDAPDGRAPAVPAPARRCRVVQVMTAIAALLIQHSPTPDALYVARTLTNDGLAIARHARAALAPHTDPLCEHVWAALLFNHGALLEMEEEPAAAREQFEAARAHARSIGMDEGVLEADAALARLDAQPHPRPAHPDDVD